MKKKTLAILLIVNLLLLQFPAAALADEADAAPCVQTADCTASVHLENCPLSISPLDPSAPESTEQNSEVETPLDNGPAPLPAEENAATAYAKRLTISSSAGQGAFLTIQEALDSLTEPVNGPLLLLIKDDLSPAAPCRIPADLNITSVTIGTDQPEGVTLSAADLVLFANGVPLIMDDGVSFQGVIFGGSDTDLVSAANITVNAGADVATLCGGGLNSTVTGDISLTVFGQADTIIGGGCAYAAAASADVCGDIQITVDGDEARLGSRLIGGGCAYADSEASAAPSLQANVQGSIFLAINCPFVSAEAAVIGGGYAEAVTANENRSLTTNVDGQIQLIIGSNTKGPSPADPATGLTLYGGGFAAVPADAAQTQATALVGGGITLDASENLALSSGRENWTDAMFTALYGKGYASGAQADAAVLGETVVSLARRVPLNEVTAKTALFLTDTSLEEALNGATAAAQYDVTVTKAVTKSDDTLTETPVKQLSNPIKLVFTIPASLQTAPSGKERHFTMLRTHDAVTVALPDEDNDPSTYTVSSNQFSLYTLAYHDTSVIDPPVEYRIELPSQTPHGQLSVSTSSAASGSTITITATPDTGYVLGTISATDSAGYALTLTRQANGSYTLIMPASAVTLQAVFSASGSHSSSSGSSSSYPIIVPDQLANGRLTVSSRYAVRGSTITLTLQPDAGYTLEQVSVTDGKGTALTLTASADGTFTFTMPASRVAITAVFTKQTLPFIDVQATDWFYQAVAEAYEQGLMSGTSPITFAPDAPTTRGMIVAVLHRLEGEPAASGTSFDDVAEDQYYASAISWANAKGIVAGYDASRFGPDDPITREQMAAILYRYAASKGYPASKRADLSAFRDAAQISPYAADVLSWANAEGLITGMGDGLLNPGGYTTRAQAAAILLRFKDAFLK